jgi:hypothetical protein|nr:MAG TPA: hypothetical protein [Caudoviricetes sp.]
MLNYKENDKKLIESGRYKYYDFTEEIVQNIVSKQINDVENTEWRILLQMLYPRNMIGSGLFQPILIFKISKNGKRVDPPLEAYDSINDLKEDTCLLFKIIEHIEQNSKLKIHNSWYKAKEKILKEEENRYVKNKR